MLARAGAPARHGLSAVGVWAALTPSPVIQIRRSGTLHVHFHQTTLSTLPKIPNCSQVPVKPPLGRVAGQQEAGHAAGGRGETSYAKTGCRGITAGSPSDH